MKSRKAEENIENLQEKNIIFFLKYGLAGILNYLQVKK